MSIGEIDWQQWQKLETKETAGTEKCNCLILLRASHFDLLTDVRDHLRQNCKLSLFFCFFGVFVVDVSLIFFVYSRKRSCSL